MNKIFGNNFRGKKVLVFGLGLLGGGVATINWLIKHGAKVTVTDLKSEDYLELSLRRLKGKPRLKLNGHDKKDVEDNEIIVFNPDVSIKNPFVKYAQKIGRQIENEATIFYKLCPRPILAVTGTRGKTTTASWAGHFLNGRFKAIVSGNSYVEPLLKTLDRASKFNYVVNEIPSYHLEYFNREVAPPEVAIITNLYRDHLNRHGTMEDYALTKAAIFKNQTADQSLIVNHANKWTPFFLKQKTRARVWFFSVKPLPKKSNGVFYKDGRIYFQDKGTAEVVMEAGDFVERWGDHNLENLLASSLAASIAGVSWEKIQQLLKKLPQVAFRQETIFASNRSKIINDTSATSPDGGIAAINRFAGPSTILITGGTDRELEYTGWAKVLKAKFKPANVVFLGGSATTKMLKALGWDKEKLSVCENLNDCFDMALNKAGKYSQSVILFSPAAKSFEKFKNEFDRGRQFNLLANKFARKS